MSIKSIWITKLKEAKTTRAMTITLLVLLAIVALSVFAFGILLTRLTLDDADFWLKVVSGVFAAIVFASGLAALVTGHFASQAQANKIQAQVEKMLTLEKEAAEARRDAAAANQKTQELLLKVEEEARKRLEAEEKLERVRKKVYPRGLTSMEPLMKGPKARAEILYQPDHFEAFRFARDVYLCLMAAGWEVQEPTPFLRDESRPHLPSAFVVGAMDSDVTIRARWLEEDTQTAKTPYATLHRFFSHRTSRRIRCRMKPCHRTFFES